MSFRVETAEGVVIGESDGDVSVWRGIPYADAPVGALRWRAPKPVVPWKGVRDATAFGAVSCQIPSRQPGSLRASVPQSEDCLSLNVWSPAAPSAGTGTALRPVLVWIHGGSQTVGAGSLPDFSGRFLSGNGDIVVVTINYRLGALGWADFSSFRRGRHGFDSNLGLRDQVAALEWVQRNIRAFGGDPRRVTIMGESSGGTAITTLMATPAAAGLFRAAVAQSPVAAAVYDRELSAERAARLLQILSVEPREVERLREVPVPRLLRAMSALVDENTLERPGTLALGPVVDGAYLPRHPLEVLAAGQAHPVPLMIGTTRDEAELFAFGDPPLLPLRHRQTDGLIARLEAEVRAAGRADAAGVRERLQRVYGARLGRGARHALAADWTFTMPSLRAADGHAGAAPTFVYRYDYVPPALALTGFGATHGTELPLFFGTLDAPIGRLLVTLGGRGALRKRSAQMQNGLIAFVRAGDPGWPRYSPASRAARLFGRRIVDTEHPATDRMPAWDGIRFTE
ncbi:carboxylesterase/lipase family protein [Okibacterium endophyticum]